MKRSLELAPPPKKEKQIKKCFKFQVKFLWWIKKVSNSLWLLHKEGRSILFCFYVFLSDSGMGLWLLWPIECGRSATGSAFHPSFKRSGSFCFLSWKARFGNPELLLRNPTICWRDQVQRHKERKRTWDYKRKRPTSFSIPTETGLAVLPSQAPAHLKNFSPTEPPDGCIPSWYHVE